MILVVLFMTRINLVSDISHQTSVYFLSKHPHIYVLFSIGKTKEWHESVLSRLKASRRYLKTDFPVHLEPTSTILDHCMQYALSTGEAAFTNKCVDHQHESSCDRCGLLHDVLAEIEVSLLALESISRYLYVPRKCKQTMK